MGMDTVELLVEIEDYFEINITNIEAENIETVGDFQQCILDKLRNQKSINTNTPYYEAGDVFEILKQIIHQKLSVPLSKITPFARITYDLGID